MSRLQLQPDVMLVLKQSIKDENQLNKLLDYLTIPPMYTTLRFDINQQCEATKQERYDMFIHPVLSDCILIKNRGPQKVVKADTEIIVDLACGMAVLRGAHVYKQGIMGAPHHLKVGDTASVFADKDGKCLKGWAAHYDGNKFLVGNGIAQVSRNDLFNSGSECKSGIGVLMSHPVYEAPSLADLDLAWVYPQNLPSITCVHVLDPQRGEVILDMCAAPGGKTTHIAALMRNEGRIVALEKSKDRAKKMEHFRSKCLEIYTFDSTKALSTDADLQGGPPYPPATFDRILVDAPCSALGQRPCFVNKISVNQLRSFPVIQHKLLLTAVELLKPGGVLVYSTCTVTTEENEQQVSKLLSKCPDMELVSTPFKLGGDALAESGLNEEQRSKVQRFDPTSADTEDKYNIDTIGFFIAKFQKRIMTET